MRFENREIRSMGRCSKWERFEVGEIRSREVKGSRSSNCSEGEILSEYRSCRSHSLTNEIDEVAQERRATQPGCRVPVQVQVDFGGWQKAIYFSGAQSYTARV